MAMDAIDRKLELIDNVERGVEGLRKKLMARVMRDLETIDPKVARRMKKRLLNILEEECTTFRRLVRTSKQPEGVEYGN